jgi:predicted metal-dependent phosphotriesterase family hydrolase
MSTVETVRGPVDAAELGAVRDAGIRTIVNPTAPGLGH